MRLDVKADVLRPNENETVVAVTLTNHGPEVVYPVPNGYSVICEGKSFTNKTEIPYEITLGEIEKVEFNISSSETNCTDITKLRVRITAACPRPDGKSIVVGECEGAAC